MIISLNRWQWARKGIHHSLIPIHHWKTLQPYYGYFSYHFKTVVTIFHVTEHRSFWSRPSTRTPNLQKRLENFRISQNTGCSACGKRRWLTADPKRRSLHSSGPDCRVVFHAAIDSLTAVKPTFYIGGLDRRPFFLADNSYSGVRQISDDADKFSHSICPACLEKLYSNYVWIF